MTWVEPCEPRTLFSTITFGTTANLALTVNGPGLSFSGPGVLQPSAVGVIGQTGPTQTTYTDVALQVTLSTASVTPVVSPYDPLTLSARVTAANPRAVPERIVVHFIDLDPDAYASRLYVERRETFPTTAVWVPTEGGGRVPGRLLGRILTNGTGDASVILPFLMPGARDIVAIASTTPLEARTEGHDVEVLSAAEAYVTYLRERNCFNDSSLVENCRWVPPVRNTFSPLPDAAPRALSQSVSDGVMTVELPRFAAATSAPLAMQSRMWLNWNANHVGSTTVSNPPGLVFRLFDAAGRALGAAAPVVPQRGEILVTSTRLSISIAAQASTGSSSAGSGATSAMSYDASVFSSMNIVGTPVAPPPPQPDAGPFPTGNFRVYDNDVLLATVPVGELVGGTYVPAPYSLAAGTHRIRFEYDGDEHFTAPVTGTDFTLGRAKTHVGVALSSFNPVIGGSSFTATAYVQSTDNQLEAPTGSVRFLVDGVERAVVPLGGTGSVSVQLPPGRNSVEAHYDGDANYQPWWGYRVFDVSAPAPPPPTIPPIPPVQIPPILPPARPRPTTLRLIGTKLGNRPALTTRLTTAASALLVSPFVDFYVGHRKLGTTARRNGTLALPSDLPAGTHTVKAVYRGDAATAKSQATMRIRVTRPTVMFL